MRMAYHELYQSLKGSVTTFLGNNELTILISITNLCQVGPVCGARMDPQSKLIVPVTMGDSPPPTNKGSPIQISMLEEELMARSMFWRRQRATEDQINSTLHQLKSIILDALPETVDEMADFNRDVDEMLVDMERDTHHLAESHLKEEKRRGDILPVYAQQLPLIPVAIATENDEEESVRESELNKVYKRIPEVVHRHMTKVESELNKFLERRKKSTAHGAETAREKHEAMTERLQNDIKTQLSSR